MCVDEGLLKVIRRREKTVCSCSTVRRWTLDQRLKHQITYISVSSTYIGGDAYVVGYKNGSPLRNISAM